MKKLTLSLLAALAVASPSFAGTTVVSSKEYKQPVVAEPCFRDQEFSLDLFYSFNDGRPSDYFSDGSGGGLALNYFFARYIGVSVEGNWWGGGEGDVLLHQVTSNLVLRYPIEGAVCWAPYVFGGGGYIFNGHETGFLDAGAGLEIRLTHTLGFFADWRWNFTDSENDVSTTRAGFRFVF